MSWFEVQWVYRVHSCRHKSGRIRFTGSHMGHRFRWLPSAVTKPRARAWKKRAKRERRTFEEKVNQRFESFTLEVDSTLKTSSVLACVCDWWSVRVVSVYSWGQKKTEVFPSIYLNSITLPSPSISYNPDFSLTQFSFIFSLTLREKIKCMCTLLFGLLTFSFWKQTLMQYLTYLMKDIVILSNIIEI